MLKEIMLKENKNIIIIGGTRDGRQNFLLKILSSIPSTERICVIEKIPEISIDNIRYKSNKKIDKIIQTYCNKNSTINEKSIAILSTEDIEITKDILSSSRYKKVIFTSNKLNPKFEQYISLIIKLKEDNTLNTIKVIRSGISIQQDVCGGEPCIEGTRISVANCIEYLFSEKVSIEDMKKDFQLNDIQINNIKNYILSKIK